MNNIVIEEEAITTQSQAQESLNALVELKNKIKTIKDYLQEEIEKSDEYQSADIAMQDAKKTKLRVKNRIYNANSKTTSELKDLQLQLKDEKEVFSELIVYSEKKNKQLQLFIDDVQYIPKLTATVVKKK